MVGRGRHTRRRATPVQRDGARSIGGGVLSRPNEYFQEAQPVSDYQIRWCIRCGAGAPPAREPASRFVVCGRLPACTPARPIVIIHGRTRAA